MRVRAICTAKNAKKNIVISCGNGQQTLKWLALTAAARYNAHSNTRYIPTSLADNCSSKSILFLHPMDIIIDHFEHMDVVQIELAEVVHIGEHGAPALSRWATVAFSLSESQGRARVAALEEERKICEDREKAIDDHRRAIRKREAESKAFHMREIMREKLHDEREISHAMAEDWASMQRNSNFGELCRNPAHQRDLKIALRANYVALSELFKFYAASSGGVGTSNEMEMAEYSSFVIEASIFKPAPYVSDVMHELFNYSLRGENTKNMDRASFLVSTIFLAWIKFIDGGRSTQNPVCKNIPRDLVGRFLCDTKRSLAEAFEELIAEHLQPLIAKHGVGTVVKYALNDDEVLAMYYDHLPLLHKVFSKYSNSISPDEVQRNTISEAIAMTLSQFKEVIKNSGLIGGDHRVDELTNREVRQAFAGAITESSEGDSATHPLVYTHVRVFGI